MKIQALKGKVLVTDLERGARIINGIIIPNDDGKSEGIRPRWSKVYSVGEGVEDVQPGQWVLVEHLRWTRMITVKEDDGSETKIWGIEWPSAALLVSDEDPFNDSAIFSNYA